MSGGKYRTEEKKGRDVIGKKAGRLGLKRLTCDIEGVKIPLPEEKGTVKD